MASILTKTGLPLANGVTCKRFRDRLAQIVQEHFWTEAGAPGSQPTNNRMPFVSVADAWVTPFRLRNRLVQIEKSAVRVYAGTSRNPQSEKIIELLGRLGFDRTGRRLRHSGTEKEGYAGSESTAIRLCLVRAVMATDSPSQGYRGAPKGRPWASTELDSAIESLVRYVKNPNTGPEKPAEASRAICRWSRWAIRHVKDFISTDMNRHRGNKALDNTLMKLAAAYKKAFGKEPTLYVPFRGGQCADTNEWDRFLQAVLAHIYHPEPPPSEEKLRRRFRHLLYPEV